MDNFMTPEEISLKFIELHNTPSDINEHLPILLEYANKCDHCTEMGVRGCVSLFAFLASKAKKVVAIDILDVWTPPVEKLTFICANDLEIEIEETDFLWIDTLHQYGQLKQELELHGNKARKYIGFHDTFMFGRNGDDGSSPGLLQAINEFLEANPHWNREYHTDNNNGCTIIARK